VLRRDSRCPAEPRDDPRLNPPHGTPGSEDELGGYLFGDWIRTRGEVTSYQQISTATWAVGAAGLVAGLAGVLLYLDLRARKETLTLEGLRADLQASAA
jgi:hypothetical protein